MSENLFYLVENHIGMKISYNVEFSDGHGTLSTNIKRFQQKSSITINQNHIQHPINFPKKQ